MATKRKSNRRTGGRGKRSAAKATAETSATSAAQANVGQEALDTTTGPSGGGAMEDKAIPEDAMETATSGSAPSGAAEPAGAADTAEAKPNGGSASSNGGGAAGATEGGATGSGAQGTAETQGGPGLGTGAGGPQPGGPQMGGPQMGGPQMGGPQVGGPQGAAAQQAAAEKITVFGNAVWLMTQSAAHKHLFLTDMEWLVLPPIALNQFRIWRNNNMPVAFASWAYLNEEAEERIKQNIKRLAPVDWKSGSNLWLIDMIAPFGGADEAVKEMREKVFAGQKVKSLQPAPGGGVAVVEW